MKNKKRNYWLLFIILIVFLSIGSGIVGGIIGRLYILENFFNFPLFGEVNLDRNLFGFPANLIIREAKNVIVEQDKKIKETAVSVSENLVGIYRKSDLKQDFLTRKNQPIGILNFYQTAGEGVIITNDGWIMSIFNFTETGAKSAEKSKKGQNKQKLADNYIIVTKDKKIFAVEEILIDENNDISFWRIKAVDLPVAKLSFNQELTNGQLLAGVDWRGRVKPAFIVEQIENGKEEIKFSDNYDKELILNDAFNDFIGSYLYNLNGEITAVVNREGKVKALENYKPAINSFLKFKSIKKPSLGLYYLDLSNLAGIENELVSSGVLVSNNKGMPAVVKGGPADLVGIKTGDIILSVNKIELNKNNSLSRAINNFLPGEEISLSIDRDGEIKEIKVKLFELK